MSSYRSIKSIAKRAHLSVDEVLVMLLDAGLPYHSAGSLVAQSRLSLVEEIVGIGHEEAGAANSSNAPVGTLDVPRKQKHRAPRLDGPAPPGPLRHTDLPIVGHPPTGEMNHLEYGSILFIHNQLVEKFADSLDPIDPPGPREEGHLLSSAATRPKTSLGTRAKYPTIEMAAGALLHALVKGHPFHNGNKRTAVVALLVFLDLNGYILTATEDDVYNYVLELAGRASDGQPLIADQETIKAAEWILRYSRKLDKSQRTMKWRDLQGILREYGCTFEHRTGNALAIRRGSLICHTGARNDGAEMDQKSVAYIRKCLELDETHGIDSLTFFRKEGAVPEFINTYRQLLRRLAPL